jgi:hypothetical protein
MMKTQNDVAKAADHALLSARWHQSGAIKKRLVKRQTTRFSSEYVLLRSESQSNNGRLLVVERGGHVRQRQFEQLA